MIAAGGEPSAGKVRNGSAAVGKAVAHRVNRRYGPKGYPTRDGTSEWER